MKVLICGLGSIGQRHARILRKIFGKDVDIGAVRTRKRAIVINDDMTVTDGIDPIKHYGLIEYSSFNDAYQAGQDAVFVTNPISMHVETALHASRHNAHVFVEKPLSHDLNQVNVLAEEIDRRGLTAMVGYQLRFHPMFEHVKRAIDQRLLGDIIAADVHFGEWLPGMHPYEDYRESHAARADQGGGVILALSHEVDLVSWLFGIPETVAATGGHISDLEMAGVEDAADLLLTYRMGTRPVPVHVHLDFIQRPPKRYGSIVGSRGRLEWDYYANEIRITATDRNVETVRFDAFRRNDMFEGELNDFFAAIQDGRPPRVSLSAGIETLKICLAARSAMQRGSIERP